MGRGEEGERDKWVEGRRGVQGGRGKEGGGEGRRGGVEEERRMGAGEQLEAGVCSPVRYKDRACTLLGPRPSRKRPLLPAQRLVHTKERETEGRGGEKRGEGRGRGGEGRGERKGRRGEERRGGEGRAGE